MNISKNLLSLGLIAVISGISTAQTYTGTAGTNGITDIQSDYSMSTGDGASVSVDVPLEFELPKKVAIALSDSSRNMPNSPLFNLIDVTARTDVVTAKALDPVTPYNTSGWNNRSLSYLGVLGGIYANTPISVTIDKTNFIHESDPNSIINSSVTIRHYDNVYNASGVLALTDDNDSSTTIYPATFNVDQTRLTEVDNQLAFYLYSMAYLDTIDPTDRAGKYTNQVTITVSTL